MSEIISDNIIIDAEISEITDYKEKINLKESFSLKVISYIYLTLATILTIYFGGVHYTPLFIFFLFSFYFLFYLLYFEFESVKSLLSYKQTKLVLFLMLYLILYISCQKYILDSLVHEHPVVNLGNKNFFNYGYILHLLMPIFFLVNFIILRVLAINSYFRKKLKFFLYSIGFLIAVISLSHWFYDNGKLFWFIEPYIIFTSSRARWPFVNANDAGIMMATSFFIYLGLFNKSQKKLNRSIQKSGKAKSLETIFKSKNFEKILSIFYVLLFIFTILLSLLATQSRGAWGATLFCFFIFYLYNLSQNSKKNVNKKRPFSVTRLLKNPFSSTVLINAIYIVGIFFSFVVFMGSRGEELLNSRINYAINNSMTDIRWDFYERSVVFLKDNFWFGIGFRNWNELFKTIKPDYLTLSNPVYLHSDPYQLLIEIGFFGFLPILCVSLYLIYRFIKLCILKTKSNSRTAFSYLLALLTIILASLVEFPFRIPAILFFFTVILALFCESLERDDV